MSAAIWNQADSDVRRAIRRRAILALRELFADFGLPPALVEESLPLLDEALREYARRRPHLGRARLRELAANIGLLAGEILVERRGARWVTDAEDARIGLVRAQGEAVAEPVAWALERVLGEGAGLDERVEQWLGAAA